MSLTRQNIQEKVTALIAEFPAETKTQIKVRVASWLDGLSLSNAAYTQAEQKERLLVDLVTYEGTEEE